MPSSVKLDQNFADKVQTEFSFMLHTTEIGYCSLRTIWHETSVV